MILRVMAVTGRGLVRETNEDAVLVLSWSSQSAAPQPMAFQAAVDLPATVAVADGLGGHTAGALASRLALQEVDRRSAGWGDAETVRAGLVAVDATLHAAAEQDGRLHGMGTTIAGIVVCEQDVLCFNVGDSRAYLVVDGYPEQVSTDDALMAPDGEPSGRVTQALGGGPAYRLDPHVVAVPGGAGSCRILLCTDGVTGPVGVAGLRLACQEGEPAKLAERLVTAAYRAGAPDNLSIVVVDLVRST